jgi:hypothetical protein
MSEEFGYVFRNNALSFIKWFRTSTYRPSSAIKVEDYSCPKYGSKELELVGRRTLKCVKNAEQRLQYNRTDEERWSSGYSSCEYCNSNKCEHVAYALSIPHITMEPLRKKGWKYRGETPE